MRLLGGAVGILSVALAASCGGSGYDGLTGDAKRGGPGDGGSLDTGGAGGRAATGGSPSGGGSSAGGEAAGGRQTGGTSSGGSDAGPPLPCTNSLDCVDAPGDRVICNPAAGQCVQCLASADCPENHDCAAGECVQVKLCVNSLDCTAPLVCDTNAGRCVECVTAADCDADHLCVASTCRPACTSDRQCTPRGLLCDTAGGHCAACLRDVDCEAFEHCAAGECRADRCTEGTSRCVAAGLAACAPNGSDFLPAVPCGSRETCAPGGGSATCTAWACTPGNGCASGTEFVSCSADGLTVLTSLDCSARGEVCSDGACRALVCVPRALSCVGSEVIECDTQGLGTTVVDTCTSSEYCDAVSPACRPQVCTPGAPACDGNRATTCNAQGSGFAGAGTDCGSEICVSGSCEALLCAPSESFCQGGELRMCASDGLSSVLVDTCTGGEFCDPAGGCRAQLCTPGAPACNGNSVATCNAQGSGFTSAGTPCGTLTCRDGACSDVLLTDDFEDGNSTGWTVAATGSGFGAATGTVVDTPAAADGTAHAFRLTANTSLGLFGPGATARQSFTAAAPTSVSFWARVPTTTTGATFSLGTAIVVGFATSGTFRGTGSATSYAANQWYHFEIRGIDWTAGTYAVYVDGQLRDAAVPFAAASTGSVSSVVLTVTGASSTTVSATAFFDEIVVR